jgi:hypothetical protein
VRHTVLNFKLSVKKIHGAIVADPAERLDAAEVDGDDVINPV